MWSSSAAIRYLRPGDWVVPRRGMCTAFWCAVVFILSSIILLVMSKHKGRLYQAWGSVMLGCGCCLLLICVILCIHAYFVMSATTRNRQLGLTDTKFELVPVPDARHLVRTQDEVDRLLTDSPATRPVNSWKEHPTQLTSDAGRRERLSRTVAVDVDDSGSQTSSSCPTTSSSTTATPPDRRSPPAQRELPRSDCITRPPQVASITQCQDQIQIATGNAVCRVRPLPNVDWRGDDRAATGHRETAMFPESGVSSLDSKQNLQGNDTGASVRRELGRGSAITVTPLTGRRRLETSIIDAQCPSHGDCLLSLDVNTPSQDDVGESKVTVYDNVQQLHV